MKHIWAFIARLFILLTAWLVGALMSMLAAQKLCTPRSAYKTRNEWLVAQDNFMCEIARTMFNFNK